jgi:hypothetical protein
MNVIACADGAALISSMTTLADCLEAVRTAQWALDRAEHDRATFDTYTEPDAAAFRREADRRVGRCLANLTKADVALAEKQREVDLRNAQDAQPVTIPAHRARHMISEASAVIAWLDQLSLVKPTDFDFHARFEMRRKAAWVRDMLTNASLGIA